MKKHTFLIVILALIVASCHVNTFRIDAEQDKQNAEKASNQLYALMHLDNYAETYGLFSPKFLQGLDTTKLVAYLHRIDEKLGTVDSVHLDICKTKVIEGTDSQSDYLVQYTVKRAKFFSRETFGMTEEKGVIKIYSYKIESDGFIE